MTNAPDNARYDVHYKPDGVTIDYHFCRDMGCYGGDPEHGMTLDEAINEVATYYEQQAKAWRDKTHHELSYFLNPPIYDEETGACQ